MKKTLFLSLALTTCGFADTTTRLLSGVTLDSGWYDVSKHLVRNDGDGDGQIDSQTCAAVAASNMLAYWYSQNTKDTVDTAYAEKIYDTIFDYTKNASTTISADCNFYASYKNGATADVTRSTATYIPANSGFKVDITPSDYKLNGTLYSCMSLTEAITRGLDNNLAMGLTMIQNPGRGAHALTIWGADFQTDYEGDTPRLTALYYTNSDDGEALERAEIRSMPGADGSTEFYFNDGTNRRWRIEEIAFMLDANAQAPVITDTNPIYLGKDIPSGDFSIGGKHETATSFHLNANAALNIGAGMELSSSHLSAEEKGLTAELGGKGTYVAENLDMGAAKLGKDWSGTVRLTGTTSSLSVSALNNAFVNGSATELKAATAGDWANDFGTVTATLKLANDGRTGAAALQLNDISGTKYITFSGAVSGDGDIQLADQKGGAKHTYVFSGDVKEWTGTIRSMLSKDSTLNLDFTGNKDVNAGVENCGAGHVSVSFEKGSVISGDLLNLDAGTMTITAEDGSIFNGDMNVTTLVLNGQVTITTPASARTAPAGVTTVDEAWVKNLQFNSGSSLSLNGDFDLSGVSITLSDEYLTDLQKGLVTAPLISAGTGSTLSGMATLSEAVAGYALALDDSGNLVLQSEGSLDEIDFALDSVQLTGNELTLPPMEAIPSGLDLATLDRINITLNSELIHELLRNGADAEAMVNITIGTAKGLTNVWFYADGTTEGYNGDGNGHYRLGNVPEPATGALSLLALTALAARRKRQ